jgi:hypothetical protein
MIVILDTADKIPETGTAFVVRKATRYLYLLQIPEDECGEFLTNVGEFVPDYKALRLRRQQCS